jgi:periplasmic protein TonB
VFHTLPNRPIRLGAAGLSLGAHAAGAIVLFLLLRAHPVRVFSLPGTNLGTRVELAYLPGRAPAPASHPDDKVKPRKVSARASTVLSSAAKSTIQLTQPPQVAAAVTDPSSNPASPPAAVPNSSSGSDSWGEGAIQIAFTTYSPSPAPDLSGLPRGLQGDVVIDVTIDSSGRVSELAVLHTIGYGIESSVLNTLKTWTFRPATKDGTPIASVQELHFHYGPV